MYKTMGFVEFCGISAVVLALNSTKGPSVVFVILAKALSLLPKHFIHDTTAYDGRMAQA